MSSIPNAKMKHAHVQQDAPAPDHAAASKPTDAAPAAESLTDRAKDLASEAVEVVKDRPGTVAAIGAAVLAGAAALVGAPAIARKLKGEEKKPAPKKGAAKKTTRKK